jgi:hypothetical protein
MNDSNDEHLPRFKVKFQDDETGMVLAAGTDDLDLFTKTDLLKMIRQFKKNVRLAEANPYKPDDVVPPMSEIDENAPVE